MNSKNICRIEVGRLLEVVPAGFHAVADVDAMRDAIALEMNRHPTTKRFIIAADWRRCPLLAPEVEGRVVQLFSAAHDRIERSAILLDPTNASSARQLFKLVNEARRVVPVRRRAFTSAREMHEWLREALTTQECERLRLLLSSEQGRYEPVS